MAETEITNVGGIRGVASEATLMLLLEAVKAQTRSAGQGSNNQNAARIQDAYNRTVRDGAKQQGIFKKSVVGAATATGRFAKELAVGGNRLTNFSTAIFGAESSVTGLISYLDKTVDTFRGLSSVGASFNNSIFEMISSAANSSMSLDDFATFVKQNSDVLASFGGTVTKGAQFLGEFSKTFRRDVGSTFFEMGFTIEDINEGLVDFMSLEKRRSSSALSNDKKTQTSAANYIMQLDKLAKLTGQDRKQLADKIAQQQTDAGLAARINSLQGDQQANLQSAIAFFDSQLPGVSDGFKDLMDGVAQTDLGKALETSIPGIGEYMQQVFTGEEDINEVLGALQKRFGPALSNFAGQYSKESIDQMRSMGGVTGALADVMDALFQFNQVSNLSAADMEKEQKRRDKITSTLGKFEQAVIDLRTMFVDMFYDVAMAPGGLFDSFGELGKTISDLFGPSSGSLRKIGSSTSSILQEMINRMFGSNGFVTTAIRDFSNWIKSEDFKTFVSSVNDSFVAVSGWMTDLVNDIRDNGFWDTFKDRILDLGNWIKELFLGKIVKKMTPAGLKDVQTGGILESMTNAFTNLWEGPYGKQLIDTIATWFKDLINKITIQVTGAGSKAGSSISSGEGMGTGILSQGIYSATGGWFGGSDRKGTLGTTEFLNQAEDWFSDRGPNSWLGDSRGEIENSAKSWIQDTLGYLMSAEGGSLSKDAAKDQIKRGLIEFMSTPGRYSGEDFATMQKYMSEVVIPRLDSFSNGTNGFQNFGKGTMAMLHNSEAVVPKNSPAGAVLQSFFDSQSKGSSQNSAASAAMSTGDASQSSLLKKVEELNNTMIKVAELLENSVGLQAKTVKGVKGLNTDFYRGIGR